MSQNLMVASRQWSSRPADQRYQSLSELLAALEARYKISTEGVINMGECKIVQTGDDDIGLMLNGAPRAFDFTHYSFGQACGLSKAPAAYLRELPADLVTQCLNHSMKGNRDTAKILVHANGGAEVAAFTSETYGRIWDFDAGRATEQVVRNNPSWKNPLAYKDGKFGGELVPSGLYASDRDVFMFFVDEEHKIYPKGIRGGDDQGLSRGFIVFNSETGNRSFGLMTFLYNHVCANHIIWGAEDVREIRVRHSLNAPEKVAKEVMPQLQAYVESSALKTEQGIQKALEYRITASTNPEKQEEEVVSFLAQKGFTRAVAREAFTFAQEEEGDATRLWNVIQGITAAGRERKHIDARFDLDRAAGKLMELVS